MGPVYKTLQAHNNLSPLGGVDIILVDVVHPAHAHFYRGLVATLISSGVQAQIIARDKDVTLALLESFGFSYELPPVAKSEGSSFAAAVELVARSRAIRRLIRQSSARVVLTRNPSGVLAAVGTSAKSVFDTDDGRHAGRHYWLSRPFADVVTSSHLDPENHGPRHRRYPGLKAQMILHPAHFRANIGIRKLYDIHSERLFVARFSDYTAAHDAYAKGISSDARVEALGRLGKAGTLLLSREGQGLRLFHRGRDEQGVAVPPEDFHHLLADADLYVGDSQSVTAEAAVLGVPALHLSSFSGRLFYLNYLEKRHLITSFNEGEERAFLRALDALLINIEVAGQAARRAAAELNTEDEDPAAWYLDLVEELLRTC